MAIYLLDNTLRVDICYDEEDCTYSDNIHVRINEECPFDEKILLADETNIFLTPQQALLLADALRKAAQASLGVSGEN